jgi:signal transduction histidine kinase
LELFGAQLADQHVTCQRNMDSKVPSLSGSASALRQVFVNLFQNALQAMPHGGTLTIHTRYDVGPQEVIIDVCDTGPGVPREDCSHLFEPFFTTRTEGTGLGLALCREFVVQHGGRIEYVDSEAGGATFRVVLPTRTIS